MTLRDQAYRAFIDRLPGQAPPPGHFVTHRDPLTLTDMPPAAIRAMIPRLSTARRRPLGLALSHPPKRPEAPARRHA